jgi:hypothetical protein
VERALEWPSGSRRAPFLATLSPILADSRPPQPHLSGAVAGNLSRLAIDTEGCATSNQESKLEHLNMGTFQLQMTDNTRSLADTPRSKDYALLLYADLFPGDCRAFLPLQDFKVPTLALAAPQR